MIESKASEWDVFISYNSNDISKAKIIVDDISKSGLKVWFDRYRIDPGERIREKINYGITHSSTVLLIASKSSLQSRWVLNELDAAMLREINESRRILLPLLIGNINLKDLPADIQGKNFIDLRYNFKQKYEKNRSILISALIALSNAPDEGRDIVPMGEEAVRFILAHRYRSEGEKKSVSRASIVEMIDIYLKLESNFENAIEERNMFINEYGRWGIFQLFCFFLDHSSMKITHWFNEDELREFFNEIEMFLTMQGVQSNICSKDEKILMSISPETDQIEYRKGFSKEIQ